MVRNIIAAITAAEDGAGVVAQRHWRKLLRQPADERAKFCDEVVDFFNAHIRAHAELEESDAHPKNATDIDAFVEVYLAAVYAICNGLATPFVWESAQTSRLRARQTVAAAAQPALTTAATFLVRLCEEHLLSSRQSALVRFQHLLTETGMGVPLLTLVLYAYATAVTDVLAEASNANGSVGSVDRCLEHLHLAAEVFTLEGTNGSTTQLTVAHPIYLHVARIGGRLHDGLCFFCQPVRSVNPILTGVGLADYVAYYTEAALLLTTAGNHAAAFYALTPVHSLTAMRGLKEKARIRGAGNDSPEAYPTASKAARPEGKTTAGSSASSSAAATAPACGDGIPPLSALTQVGPGNDVVALYPWYRMKPVSTTHTFSAAPSYRGEHGGEEVVEWKLILAPSTAELQRDQHIRAWAVRLSVLLLTLAFGGGNPRTIVERAGGSSWDGGRPSDGETTVDWRGVNSTAVDGHVCFPNAVFHQLSQTTRVSLDALLAAVLHSSSAEMQVYVQLLRAVAQRDVAQARALVAGEHTAALMADMTYHLAQLAVESYLLRHVLLDTARLYARVSMRHLIECANQLGSGGREEDEQQQQQQQARAILKQLAELCASEELRSCHVCTVSAVASNAAGVTEVSTTVKSVVAAVGFEQRNVDIDATSIRLAVASVPTCLRICAGVVSPHVDDSGADRQDGGKAAATETSSASPLQMLKQLQTLHHAMNAEHAALQSLR